MDRAQFAERVQQMQVKLYRTAIAILSRDQDAQDAVQEALMLAWRHLGSLREERYFDTWLMRILINECRRALRTRARSTCCPLPETLQAPKPPDPALRQALDSLALTYRLPVVLHHVDGYTVDQVARMLHLPRGAVRWRLQKGMAELRKQLTQGEVRT